MNTTQTTAMNAEDRLIYRIFLVFMSTPLVLLLLAAAFQASTAA